MLAIAGAVIGAGLGAWTARRQGGRWLDMLQYAAGFGIALALAGAIATIVLHRLAV